MRQTNNTQPVFAVRRSDVERELICACGESVGRQSGWRCDSIVRTSAARWKCKCDFDHSPNRKSFFLTSCTFFETATMVKQLRTAETTERKDRMFSHAPNPRTFIASEEKSNGVKKNKSTIPPNHYEFEVTYLN